MTASKWTPQNPLRLAMWSGPRNISTAMMRSWGNRDDTFVCDEPLYAHYLRETGVAHPGREEVIAHQENDWRKVAAWLSGPVPENKAIFYQKHMAHHLLPDISRDWLSNLTHCFLIREPREMLTSLLHILPHPRIADTGLSQQIEIFEWVQKRTGQTPPVIDSRDVLNHPRETLSQLCAALGVPFDEAMLAWPPGPRETDGIWAKWWYSAVEKTTSFQPYQPKPDPVPDDLRDVLKECEVVYERLAAHRLRPAL